MHSPPSDIWNMDLPHFPSMCQLLDTAAGLSLSFPSYHQSDTRVVIIFGGVMTIKALFIAFDKLIMLNVQA